MIRGGGMRGRRGGSKVVGGEWKRGREGGFGGLVMDVGDGDGKGGIFLEIYE